MNKLNVDTSRDSPEDKLDTLVEHENTTDFYNDSLLENLVKPHSKLNQTIAI